MGVEPTQSCFAGSRRAVWLQRQVVECLRQESNLVFDLRRVACDPQHSEDILSSAPPRNRTSSGSFEDCHALPAHPQGLLSKCLDQDLNLDLDLRRVLCDPLHHRDVFNKHPDLESNQVQGFRKALCAPLHHRDKHIRADDWICTSIERFTGPPPFSIEPRRQNKQEREESNPVRRIWNLHPLPGGHSCIAPGHEGRGLWRNN